MQEVLEKILHRRKGDVTADEDKSERSSSRSAACRTRRCVRVAYFLPFSRR